MALSRSGTYRALRRRGPKPGEGVAKTFEAISSSLDSYVKNQEEKSNRANEEFLTNIANAKLDPTNSNNLISATAEQRQAYINADNIIDKQKILNDVNSIAQDLGGIEDIIDGLRDGDIKISNTFTHSEEGKSFSKALSNPNGIQIQDGKAGIDVDGRFMDIEEINTYIKGKTMDTSFASVMSAIEYDQQEEKKDTKDKYKFDRDYVQSQVKADIYKNANLRSLFEDNLYGNRNFKTDLIYALSNQTYAGLGITEDMLLESDVNVEDGLDQQEIENITQYLMDDEFALREMLTNYYTDLIEQQFDSYTTKSMIDAEGTDQDPEVVNIG